MRLFASLIMLAATSAAWAQTPDSCPAYAQAAGTEIRFSTDDLYRKYGFQMFYDAPDGRTKLPYERLAGKRGKVTGGQPGPYRIAYYHTVLLEDCGSVYWYDTDQRLEPDDSRLGAIEFLDKPPTEWKVSENTDRMTDARSCHVTPESDMPYPMFYFHSTEGISVQVVGGDFPGRPTTFRVDKHKAIAEDEGLSGARAQALLSQIKAGGKQLLVGAYEWPNDYEVLKEFNLDGLAAQLAHCRESVKR